MSSQAGAKHQDARRESGRERQEISQPSLSVGVDMKNARDKTQVSNNSPIRNEQLVMGNTTTSSPIHPSNSRESSAVLHQEEEPSGTNSNSSSNSSLGNSQQNNFAHFASSESGVIEGHFPVAGTPSPRIRDNDPVFANFNMPLEDEERLSASSIGKRDLNELLSKSAPNLTNSLFAVNEAFVGSENDLNGCYTFGEESIFGNSSMLLSIGQKVASPSTSKQTPKKQENTTVQIQPLHGTPNFNSKRRLSHQMDSTTPTNTLQEPHFHPSPLEDDKVIDEFLEGNVRGRKSRSKSTIPTPIKNEVAMHQMSPMTPTRLAILRNATNISLKHTLPPHLQTMYTPAASPGGMSIETVGTSGSVDSPPSLSTTFHFDPQTKDSITQSLKRKYSRAGSRNKFSKSAFDDDHRLSMSLETIGIVLEHRSSANNLLSKTSMKGSDLLQAVLQLQAERKDTPMPEKTIEQKEFEELERKKKEIRKELIGMDKMQCNQRLYLACKENDTITSSLILEEFNVDVNWKNTQDMEKGYLHLCARENNTELMELLLDHNADPNMKDKVSRTPLHVACSSGSHFCMVLLLGHDASPNVRDEYGFSPLGLALKQHHFDMAKDLLLFGADVNLKLYDGSTILHDFFGNGDMEVVKFLINDLPDSHTLLTMVRNDHGWSALFCAIQNSQIDVIRYLLTSKYQTQIFNSLSNSSNSGENVFHIVAKSGDVDMLSELINIFNERESQEHKLLLQQTMSNVPNYKKNMVSQRVQTLLNYQDNMRKMTPLHIAAKTKKAVMVRELMRLTTLSNTSGELIDKKKKLYRAIDINITDKRGNTPLHYCFLDVKDRELTNSEKAMITFLSSSKACKTDIKNEKGLSVKAICKKYGINLKDYTI